MVEKLTAKRWSSFAIQYIFDKDHILLYEINTHQYQCILFPLKRHHLICNKLNVHRVHAPFLFFLNGYQGQQMTQNLPYRYCNPPKSITKPSCDTKRMKNTTSATMNGKKTPSIKILSISDIWSNQVALTLWINYQQAHFLENVCLLVCIQLSYDSLLRIWNKFPEHMI